MGQIAGNFLLQSGTEKDRSYEAGFFQIRETILGLGSLSPLPVIPDFGNLMQNRASLGENRIPRGPANFLTAPPSDRSMTEILPTPGDPPHGSRGRFQGPQNVQQLPEFVTVPDGTRVGIPENVQNPAENSPGTRESPIQLGEKRNLSPTQSVVSAGGKFQRLDGSDPPDSTDDMVEDVDGDCGPETPRPNASGQILPYDPAPKDGTWDGWFNERFEAAMSAHKAQIESFQTNFLGMIKNHHEEFKRNIGEKLLAGLEKVSGGFNDQSTADKKVILDTITGAMNLQAGLVMQECKKLMDAQNSLAKAQIEKNMGENFSNFGERLQKFEMDCSTAFQNVLARFGNLETGMKNFIGGVDTNFVAVADKFRNLDDKISEIHDFCQNVLDPRDMVVEGVVGHEDTTLSPPLPLRSTEDHQQASSSQTAVDQGPTAAGPHGPFWQPSGPIGLQKMACQTGAGPQGPLCTVQPG